MGVDITNIVSQGCALLAILVIITSINMDELGRYISGIKIETPNMVKLMVNLLILIFIASIFLIPSVKSNAVKLINKPFEYSIKLLDKFMK